ncbi:hypothetical protein [Arthrobacter woluwensis]|uniref:Alkaline shock response membrane anchor protein AmaP n=1 Tax=Arthrobacter woluwensis TaxID=156980 RepID=A0A1H4W833_9MICC|nr:hypothetical protein [Arthrobacter woluwensis]SEC88684.1 hypothetical protein SAMN04489745_3426 [Arthrobacter woluwensis]
MNGTPRRINRFFTGLVGLVVLAAGVFLMVVSAVPAVAQAWHRVAEQWVEWFHRRYESTPLLASSWIYLVAVAVLLVIVLLTVRWISVQGQGRVSLLVDHADDSPTPGDVTISGNVAEQMLRAALAGRSDLLGLSVGTYQYRGVTGLRVRLYPRKGASPQKLVREVGVLLQGLDSTVGQHTPVLLHLGTGTRALFTREERVL